MCCNKKFWLQIFFAYKMCIFFSFLLLPVSNEVKECSTFFATLCSPWLQRGEKVVPSHSSLGGKKKKKRMRRPKNPEGCGEYSICRKPEKPNWKSALTSRIPAVHLAGDERAKHWLFLSFHLGQWETVCPCSRSSYPTHGKKKVGPNCSYAVVEKHLMAKSRQSPIEVR